MVSESKLDRSPLRRRHADLITVVVPVGQVDDRLRDELRALATQDIDRPFEVVLALNTSDPTSRAVLDAMVRDLDDPRFRVVLAIDHRGASHARNVGAAAGTGEILAFCDADDIVEPSWLGSLIDGLDHYDAVSCQFIDQGRTERQTQFRPPATPGRLPSFLGVPYLLSSSLAIPRAVFDEVGGFDENMTSCEDIAISWSLLGKGRRLGFVPKALLHYRHRTSLFSMLHQHFRYGRGMAQLLLRYGIPNGDEWQKPRGIALLRPNRQPGGRRSLGGLLRRIALAAGRVAGIMEEQFRLTLRGTRS